MSIMSTALERRCVYTSLIGGYEDLNEQPVQLNSGMRFICLTDDENLRSDTWEIRVVKPIFPMDAVRSQREFKLRPYLHLPDFDASLYIDNRVLLSVPPEEVIERYAHDSDFIVPTHSHRESVLDEFIEIARIGYDDETRLFEQLNHYALTAPDVLEARPTWNAILIRDHNDPQIRAMLELWLSHVNRYSRRDQLSFSYAASRTGLSPRIIEIDNFSSWFHKWPNGNRHPGPEHAPGRSLRPLVGRIRELEQDLAEQSSKGAELAAANAELQAEVDRLTALIANRPLYVRSRT